MKNKTKNKKTKKVRFDLGAKIALGLLIVSVLIALSIFVQALSAGQSPNPGHTLEGVAPPFACASGEYLRWNNPSGNNGNWECVDFSEIQKRVSGSCIGRALVSVNSDGTVNCEDDDFGSSSDLQPTLVYSYTQSAVGEYPLGNYTFCGLIRIERKSVGGFGNGGCGLVRGGTYQEPSPIWKYSDSQNPSWNLVIYDTRTICTVACLGYQ